GSCVAALRYGDVLIQLAIEHLYARQNEFHAREHILCKLRVNGLPVIVQSDPAKDRNFAAAHHSARATYTFARLRHFQVGIVWIRDRQIVNHRLARDIAGDWRDGFYTCIYQNYLAPLCVNCIARAYLYLSIAFLAIDGIAAAYARLMKAFVVQPAHLAVELIRPLQV